MITKRELDGAIAECENAPASYQICEKLATFYTIREHAYKEKGTDVEHSYDGPQTINSYGDTDFLQAIQGKSPDEIWPIMDELMQAILITNPRLYDGVMRRINGQV